MFNQANRRMQTELRQAVEDKISQGFEVVERGARLLMARGAVKIELVQTGEKVVVKHA